MADEQTQEVVDQDESQNGTDGGGRSRLSALKSKEVLLPAAATAAAAAAAGLAAKKGPDVMKMLGSEAGEEAEESGRKARRLPIQRWTDVAVPVEKAYKAWTQFEEYPKFMHRVLEVEQDEDDKNKLHWREKIWFS